jgi:hypothetical protein
MSVQIGIAAGATIVSTKLSIYFCRKSLFEMKWVGTNQMAAQDAVERYHREINDRCAG